MMALREDHTLLLALIWTTCSSFTLGTHELKARIRVKRENGSFLSFGTLSGHKLNNLKLVHDPYSNNIYAGGPHGLYMLNPGETPALKKVSVPIFKPECCGGMPECISSDCGYKISLLKEGRNLNPLFMCGTRDKRTKCCDVNSEHNATGCFELINPTQITQPSLHVGDSLYYTVSTEDHGQPGLYRSSMGKFTWPPPRTTEQRYVTIFGNQGSELLDGKVYSFYMEQNQNQDPETPVWIPRVSQICTADQGGSKSVLQYRWTSMLTARLFCGDEKRHLSYTELLDIVVLEDGEWKNTIIYGLFKNAYTLRAVCFYKMSDIINVFASNNIKDQTETFSSPSPGECVENSRTLSPSLLKFMEKHPEMSQWIKPAQAPLLFMHHHYTHLQVDRVESRTSGNSHHVVLFMALENGNIHKILEQDGDPFIIAEYEPFKSKTHISSMLLNNKTRFFMQKKLFVSSSSDVIQIDPYNCSMYGNDCGSCVMARDPYCGWDLEKCSANKRSLIQDVTHGNHCVCDNDVPTTDEFRDNRDSPISVSQDSKFYLKCPKESQHALYTWDHQGRTMPCVSTDQDCLLLIDSMSQRDEGVYTCIATENGYERTIIRHELQMNTASETRATNVALAGILFLISEICKRCV
ncbi:semaphorin-7A-like [Clarias gariepinus]|uniref:semaphorin-7A-like n=1 Tax=Clarias gariepinus TaxID=13013 RepID=UPI00234D2D55|nr:semaphorin-7A-like [Clarias gariepinus]